MSVHTSVPVGLLTVTTFEEVAVAIGWDVLAQLSQPQVATAMVQKNKSNNKRANVSFKLTWPELAAA